MQELACCQFAVAVHLPFATQHNCNLEAKGKRYLQVVQQKPLVLSCSVQNHKSGINENVHVRSP
jgi:hypothetical protein